MGKPVRHILSAEQVKAADRFLRSKHESDQRLRDERQRNDALLVADGDVPVTNRDAQMGRRMHRSELVRRIKKLNPNLWYEQSIAAPEQGGMYIEDRATPYGRRMVCAFPHDWINEFTIPLTVPEVVPSLAVAGQWETIQRVDQKIPGWRAVLAKLILERLVTAAAVDREFEITKGRSSQKWQQVVN